MLEGIHRPVVLVVEDVGWIRDAMQRRLESCGYDVAGAADAAEAIAIAQRILPAAILTEEELPTYAELAAGLAFHPALARTPLIIINPDAEDDARHGNAVVLADYHRIEHLLLEPRR